MATEPKFVETYNEALDLLTKTSKEVIEYLKETLKENENEIQLDDEYCDMVCVVYDGGNHPEYDSNPYSVVYNLNLDKNGKITYDTEDAENLDFEDLTPMEQAIIGEAVHQYVTNKAEDNKLR